MAKGTGPDIRSSLITERIDAAALELLEGHPDGLRWSELLAKVLGSDPAFHPKTANGRIWRLAENYPDIVYKPSKGVFRLVSFR